MSTLASTSGIPQHTSISALTPVITHTTWSASQTRIMDPTDESFGYTLSTSMSHESRHDRRQSSPPPYSEESTIPLPEYTLQAPEPVTLAMYLFKFGFCKFSLFRIPCQNLCWSNLLIVFPPFWMFGAFILMSPLREPPTNAIDSVPAWMPEKTEDERKEIIATLRQVELKWAKRSLCAILIFTVLAVSGGLAAWAVLRHWFEPCLHAHGFPFYFITFAIRLISILFISQSHCIDQQKLTLSRLLYETLYSLDYPLVALPSTGIEMYPLQKPSFSIIIQYL